MYAPIWQEVKAKGGCRIVAPSWLHPRIKKAVSKEFGRDVDFKEQMAAEGRRAWIRKIAKNDSITFTLHKSAGPEDFGVGDADMCAFDFASGGINLEDLLK